MNKKIITLFCLVVITFTANAQMDYGDGQCGCYYQLVDCYGQFFSEYHQCRIDAIESTEGDYTGYWREVFLDICNRQFNISKQLCELEYDICGDHCYVV